MYYIAVCDDDRTFLKEIKQTIENNPDYDAEMEIDLFESGAELLAVKRKRYHLVILDMQMEGIDGYETAKQIRQENNSVVIAFCSGVMMPKPEHFRIQPYRYLIKSVVPEKLSGEISELLLEMKRRKNECYVEAAYDGKVCCVRVQDIFYIERKNRSSCMVIDSSGEQQVWDAFLQKNTKRWITRREDGTLEINSNEKLAEWYTQLYDCGFEYAHNSYIVNLFQIRSVADQEIMFMNMERLSISRKYKQQFEEHFSHCHSKKYRRDVKECSI